LYCLNSRVDSTKEIKQKLLQKFKKPLKILAYLLLLLITLQITVVILFYIFKDDISKKLLLSVNNMQKGELTLEDISFEPFAQFPSISIGINNVVYVALDVVDLIGGRINISKVKIEGGSFNLITYEDSTLNLFKALGLEKPGKVSVEKDLLSGKTNKRKESQIKIIEPKDTTTSSGIDLSIDELSIENLTLHFENHVLDRTSSLRINKLSSSFIYRSKRILSELKTDIDILQIKFPDQTLLADKKINFTTSLSLDEENEMLVIDPSNLIFENAEFDLEGTVDIGDEGFIDLKVDGSDHDFSFFALLLSKKGIKNITKGDLYFNGTIRGKSKLGIPQLKLNFGLKDLELINPVTNRIIKNLNLSGKFDSGTKNDFSQAKLRVDTLYADFPDGTLKLSGLIRNLKLPELDLNLYFKADLTGLDEIFKLDFIDKVKGKIELNDRFKGKYISKEKRFISEINIAKLSLEDFGLHIPGTMILDKVNGVISRENDNFYFDNLSVISEDTDILINGELKNLPYLFLNIEKEINASLTVKSSVFDLPNFLFFDPSIKRDFPYRIKDLELTVDASTTTTKALNFKSFPEIDFNIKKLRATAEGFLPPLTINNGRFKISENILGFHLDFDHFLTDIAGGQINLTGDYNSSKFQPFYIKADLQFYDVNPAKFLFDEQTDSIPEIIDGSLNGSLFAELQFASDTMAMKLVNIKKGDLSYYFAEDTIETKSLEFFTKDVYYNSDKDPNPLATLTTNLKIKSEKLKTDYFKIDDIYYDINAEYGTYTVIPKQKSFFGSEGRGKHTLRPFDELPYYRFQYSINKFNAEDLMQTFLEDTIITGKMDFSMDISMYGNQWDSLVSKINGDIHLTGKDLIMYGVDADELV